MRINDRTLSYSAEGVVLVLIELLGPRTLRSGNTDVKDGQCDQALETIDEVLTLCSCEIHRKVDDKISFRCTGNTTSTAAGSVRCRGLRNVDYPTSTVRTVIERAPYGLRHATRGPAKCGVANEGPGGNSILGTARGVDLGIKRDRRLSWHR